MDNGSGTGSGAGVAPARWTALVCTRNRPADVERVVRSLLNRGGQDDGGELQLLVVDQSDDEATAQLLAGTDFADRVQYVRSMTRGKGAAMNEGIRLADADVIVCTDDDCEAPPGWVSSMTELVATKPRVAVAFCRVEAPPHDRTRGYIPAYLPDRVRLMKSMLATSAHRGIGAGMAIRRDVVVDLGGMDESFGPGARFPSADDWDVQLRVLLKGWHSLETDQLSITHHGFRTYAEGREHTKRDWLALGAAAAKPIRAGHPTGLLLGLYVVVADAVVPIGRDLLKLRKPRGVQRVVSFSRGFYRGLRTPVDHRTLHFRVPAG